MDIAEQLLRNDRIVIDAMRECPKLLEHRNAFLNMSAQQLCDTGGNTIQTLSLFLLPALLAYDAYVKERNLFFEKGSFTWRGRHINKNIFEKLQHLFGLIEAMIPRKTNIPMSLVGRPNGRVLLAIKENINYEITLFKRQHTLHNHSFWNLVGLYYKIFQRKNAKSIVSPNCYHHFKDYSRNNMSKTIRKSKELLDNFCCNNFNINANPQQPPLPQQQTGPATFRMRRASAPAGLNSAASGNRIEDSESFRQLHQQPALEDSESFRQLHQQPALDESTGQIISSNQMAHSTEIFHSAQSSLTATIFQHQTGAHNFLTPPGSGYATPAVMSIEETNVPIENLYTSLRFVFEENLPEDQQNAVIRNLSNYSMGLEFFENISYYNEEENTFMLMPEKEICAWYFLESYDLLIRNIDVQGQQEDLIQNMFQMSMSKYISNVFLFLRGVYDINGRLTESAQVIINYIARKKRTSPQRTLTSRGINLWQPAMCAKYCRGGHRFY